MRWISRVVGARLREDVIDKVSGVCERDYVSKGQALKITGIAESQQKGQVVSRLLFAHYILNSLEGSL